MALPDYTRIANGTAITFKSSGGSAAITLASLANGSYRQSAKADFGSSRADIYLVEAEVEMAATPTAGAEIAIYLNPSSSSTAATDNKGGCSGSDAAYTGYSSNASASVPQLIFVGSHICTAQATATVQKSVIGTTSVPLQYASIVVHNNSGAAFHSSDTNVVIRFTPIEGVIQDT